MRKKKILLINESSFLKTGYSTYGFETLKRLHATNKYEIAELGCFARSDDPQRHQLPWKFYGNLPNNNDKVAVDFYNSNQSHAFGSWKFEEILLDFQPDIVWDIRDWWNFEFEERSPFRNYYHWVIMPPVDSVPQHPQWISTFANADAVFSYSDWGLSVLKGNNKLINVVASAPPGADLKTFNIIKNKKDHKKNWGIPEDSFIIGTVMRNQKRKLYPDLIESFRMFLNEVPPYIAEKSYLYLHTSYPDWWDIPSLIIEHEVSHRIIITYKCRACKNVFASFFQDARNSCPRCYQQEAFLPNTHMGIERNELASIINLFDVYVQYSNSEGFGMPQVEASSCGVPVFAIDYSAMSDVVRKIRGYPIKYLKLAKEADTGCNRAIPDNVDFVNQLVKFAQLPETWRNKKGFEARKATELHYDWDKTSKIWEKHFDSVPLKDVASTWESPVKIHEPNTEIPINLTPEQFIQWAIINVAGRPELCNHYMAMRLIRDIQWQSTTEHTGDIYFNDLSAIGTRPKRKDFTREDALKELRNICDYNNFWEQKRWAKITAK